MALTHPRKTWFVDYIRAYPGRTGKSQGRGFATLQAAVDIAEPGDTLRVFGVGEAYESGAPDGYDEEVTIPVTKPGLTIIGEGNRGAVFIAPSTGNKTGLIVRADDVTLINIGCAGKGTGKGLVVYGSRFRAKESKIEGGAVACELIGGQDKGAGVAVGGAEPFFDDCEFAWSTDGVKISQGFVGAVTQARFRGCRFHNLTNAHFIDGAGAAAGLFRNLLVEDCGFEGDEDGNDPTKYFSLNGSNSNSGTVRRCSFPVTLTSGKNLVSTAVKWIDNRHPAGLSTGQPS